MSAIGSDEAIGGVEAIGADEVLGATVLCTVIACSIWKGPSKFSGTTNMLMSPSSRGSIGSAPKSPKSKD